VKAFRSGRSENKSGEIRGLGLLCMTLGLKDETWTTHSHSLATCIRLNLVEKDRNIGQDRVMDKGQVISKLRDHRDELTAAGIVHLRVFGSVARGEANDSSDVDLIAEFDNKKKLTAEKLAIRQERRTSGAKGRTLQKH